MSFPFNPQQGLIVVRVGVVGPSGSAVLRLALDTGATGTAIDTGLLVSLGYDPSLATTLVRVTTGSGVAFAPLLTVLKLSALGHDHVNFPVLCLALPPSASVDGLLGLDFLRGRILTLDFQAGQITLS
jgi:hypothetical protein